MASSFRQRVLERETLIGSLTSIPHPAIQDLMCLAGFDWLFIDGEHAPLGAAEISLMVQSSSKPALVRIPEKSNFQAIKSALDSGAVGIIAPLVNTASEATAVVQAARYPPVGSRSVGVGRAHAYGLDFDGYLNRANEETVVVVQVEHIQAVENIEEIVRVPGVDCVFVGPYDLSGSLGIPGQVTDNRVVDAMNRVVHVCKAAGMPMGSFGVTAEAIRNYHQRGFTLLAFGMDTLFLGPTARSGLEAVRSALSPENL